MFVKVSQSFFSLSSITVMGRFKTNFYGTINVFCILLKCFGLLTFSAKSQWFKRSLLGCFTCTANILICIYLLIYYLEDINASYSVVLSLILKMASKIYMITSGAYVILSLLNSKKLFRLFKAIESFDKKVSLKKLTIVKSSYHFNFQIHKTIEIESSNELIILSFMWFSKIVFIFVINAYSYNDRDMYSVFGYLYSDLAFILNGNELITVIFLISKRVRIFTQ